MASIVQNLPSAAAKLARSAGRNSSNPEKSESATFDQILRQSTRQDQARKEPPENEGKVERPSKSKTGKVERKPEAVEDSSATSAPSAQDIEPTADSQAQETAESPAPVAEEAAIDQAGVEEGPGEITTAIDVSTSVLTTAATAENTATANIAIPAAAGPVVAPEADQPLTGVAASATAKVESSAQQWVKSSPSGAATPTGEQPLDELIPAAGNVAVSAEPTDAQVASEAPPVTESPVTEPAKHSPGPKLEQKNQQDTQSLEAPIPTAKVDASTSAGPVTAQLSTPAPDPSVAAAAGAAASPIAPATPHNSAMPIQPQHTSARFIEANHEPIVSAVRGQLLPDGGTMQIRLDPPELGALMVQISVRGGLIDASFQTQNAEATQLLSHSLTQLKHSLENQGVSVDKLSVAQAPKSERSDQQSDRNPSQQQQGNAQFDWERHSDQQRKEMLRRMWAKLGVGDPLDLVA